MATEITPASFTTPMVQPGHAGVQLNKALTELSPEECVRLSNWVHTGNELAARPGLTFFQFGLGSPIHSFRRGNATDSTLTSLFWGAGQTWVRSVNNGLPMLLESGFSGDPLTMIPIRKPLASGSWMLVADRTKMRKAGLAATGSLPIGLPAPTAAPATTIAATYTIPICAFQASDGSNAAAWTLLPGFGDEEAVSSSAPTAADIAGVSGNAVAFTLAPGTVKAGYQSEAVLAKPMNLRDWATFAGGPTQTSDDDLIHLYLRLSNVALIREVRVYFVCSPLSLTRAIPGTVPNLNTAAFMHAFTPSDYDAFVSALETGAEAAARAAAPSLLHNVPTAPGQLRKRTPGALPTGTFAIPRIGSPTSQGGLGSDVWQEFSRIGLPVRRGDFVAIGTAGDPGTDWSTITGVYLLFWTTAKEPVTIALDDCYITGGAGPDTTEPGSQQYDYRVIHVDTRTGARSNGSPTQAQSFWLDSKRQPIRVTSAAYGDPFVRQEAYRRGGSLTDNWYFTGTSGVDGGAILDTHSDADIASSDTLPTDNFQPVPTLDDNGTTVLAQPVPIVFGPIDDGIYCALGDPYRPGHLYSCIAGQFDAWPSTSGYVVELCAPSEELMNGCVWGGEGFVLSRERGYSVHANPAEPGIVATPTECRPGLAVRWGFTSGPGGIFYVARDGVRVTDGGGSTLLGANQIRPLFHGDTVEGRLPIDWAVPTAIRLVLHDLDLRLLYQDTGGITRVVVFSLLYQYWRFEDFTPAPVGMYSDQQVNTQTTYGATRLLVGPTDGQVYVNSGFTDNGTGIPLALRTGAWTFGAPRQQKVLGDLALDLDLAGAPATLTTLLNGEVTANPAVAIPAVAGRHTVILQPFPATAHGDPQQAQSVSIDLTLTAPLTGRPKLYLLGVAAEILPELTTDRVLAWGTWSTLSDKYLKGFILDADTFSAPITLHVLADGVLVVTVIATHVGRAVQTYTFPQVLGRVFQIVPVSGLPAQVLALQPLFDEEPYALARWETQLLDLALPGAGWGMVLSTDFCYRSTAVATLRLDCYQESGVLFLSTTKVLPSTGGTKRKIPLFFDANKGILFKLTATTNDASPGLTIYQEESRLRIQQWGGSLVLDRPLGDDDLDSTRNMINAIYAAAKPGGGT